MMPSADTLIQDESAFTMLLGRRGPVSCAVFVL